MSTSQIVGWLILCPFSSALSAEFRPTESGGPLSAEQASYDVLAYDLALRLNPEEKSIHGRLALQAAIVQPVSFLLLDLDDRYQVHSVRPLGGHSEPESLPYTRPPGKLLVSLETTRQPGERVGITIEYSGKPKEAPRPPWVGGFIWGKDREGRPWIAVACQVDGADLWWPCKDHPSDEPDRMELHITVPAPLVVASNGTLDKVTQNADDTLTYHWKIINPINTYNVTINVAYYHQITADYESTSGETIPLTYWVLPENREKASSLFEQIPRHLRFLEGILGPYPFRNEKYGVVETPYLGMEHQTIISYGNGYRDNVFGFDWLHLHELAHEWWGNLVTVTDWRDYWIHEGFASYMEALYAENLRGPEALYAYVSGFQRRTRNQDPLAPTESRTTVGKYFVPPGYTFPDGDVNFKGACVLHTLRYVIGDDAFYKALRRFLYPDPHLELATDGSQCRFVATTDFVRVVETVSQRELGWFFDLYLRQPQLPRLRSTRDGRFLTVRWETPDDLPFPMPLEVEVDGVLKRMQIDEGGALHVEVPPGAEIRLDPNGWILKEISN